MTVTSKLGSSIAGSLLIGFLLAQSESVGLGDTPGDAVVVVKKWNHFVQNDLALVRTIWLCQEGDVVAHWSLWNTFMGESRVTLTRVVLDWGE